MNMDTHSEIKPCPFCGFNADVCEHIINYNIFYSVICNGCVAEGPKSRFEENAIEGWNRREYKND